MRSRGWSARCGIMRCYLQVELYSDRFDDLKAAVRTAGLSLLEDLLHRPLFHQHPGPFIAPTALPLAAKRQKIHVAYSGHPW